MRIGVATVQLRIPASHSLKDKRQVVRSAIQRLRQRFNVSVAEVGTLDEWQSTTLGIACVANDGDYAQAVLGKAIAWLAAERLDAEIGDVSTEVL